MKSVSAALGSHLDQEVTTLARMWKIVRTDGQVFTFTSHDAPLTFSGDIYSSTYGFANTAIQNKSDLSVDNLDVGGVFDSDNITLEDLRAGLFDYADVFVFVVNWADLTQGALKLRRGKLGECTASPQGWFHTELRGMTQLLQQNVVELYGPECRADLFDTRCALLESLFSSTAHITAVTDATHVTIALDTTQGTTTDDTWFQYGVFKFTSGLNNGRSAEIKSWNHITGVIELYLTAGYVPSVGDTVTLWPGCDKSLATCKAKFNNRLNFRGEPYLPGNDQLFYYPDSK